ncbi:uncharacterized protein ISCGN_003930 [Ixodes scapularis]
MHCFADFEEKKSMWVMRSTMSLFGYCAVFLWSAVLQLGSDVYCVHILHLSVPKWVENGTEDSVVLDCVYSVAQDDQQLVVKWFLNDDPQPIYQWIPELEKRHVSQRLRGRLNLDFSLSSGNSFTKFRALNLVRPTTELGGRYSCHVNSLASQDAESKLMTVYAPPKRFDFSYERLSPTVTELSCEVDGVFPLPTLFLYQSSGRDLAARALGTSPSVAQAEGAYKIRLTHAVDSRTLEAGLEHIFECVLSIPETNFKRQRRLEFEPGSLVSGATSSQMHLSTWAAVVGAATIITIARTGT